MSERSRMPRGGWRAVAAAPVVPVAGAVVLAAFPLVSGDAYRIRELSLIAVLALVIGGLNLTLGQAGELQFAQVFVFGLGCYVTMALAIHVTPEFLVLLSAGAVAAAVAGGLIGLLASRAGGWSLAIVSLFLLVALPDLVAVFPRATGGLNGLLDIPAPRLLGRELGAAGLCVVAVVAAALWFGLYRNVVRSRYGVMLSTLRHSPMLLAGLGGSPARVRAGVHAVGALPAGVAGCLFGFISLVVTPSAFGLSLAIGVVAAAILGGVRTVYGAIVGATVLQLGPESSLTLGQYAPLGYGLFLIAVAVGVRARPGGGRRWLAPRPVAARGEAPQDAAPLALDGAALEVRGVSRSFGAVRALDDVSLTARPGTVTGLMGANGSGKTTLLNLVSGFGRPAAGGAIVVGGVDVTGRPPHAIAAAGVARTFQAAQVPAGVSVLDAVAAGRFARDPPRLLGAALRLPGHRRSARADRREALAVLQLAGLADRAEQDAATLSLGGRRMLELARALAARPRVLLLDEPASGLDAGARDRLAMVLRRVARAGGTVVVIEHDATFLAAVADDTYMLEAGRLVGAAAPPRRLAAVPALGPLRPRRRSDETVLHVSRLAAGHGRAAAVLRDATFVVGRGEVALVQGANGVGKTTLLATIAGLVPHRAGTIVLAGRDVGRLAAHRRAAAGIAFVPEGKRVFRERTVMENLTLGAFALTLSRRERRALCEEVLARFPALVARAHERAGDLSGGQQQMLAIGQALAARPRLLLLDEPSAGLAPAVASEVYAALGGLADRGMAVMVVDHQAQDAPAIADQVMVLRDGVIGPGGRPDIAGSCDDRGARRHDSTPSTTTEDHHERPRPTRRHDRSAP